MTPDPVIFRCFADVVVSNENGSPRQPAHARNTAQEYSRNNESAVSISRTTSWPYAAGPTAYSLPYIPIGYRKGIVVVKGVTNSWVFCVRWSVSSFESGRGDLTPL